MSDIWTKFINQPKALGLPAMDPFQRAIFGLVGRRIVYDGSCSLSRGEIAESLEFEPWQVKKAMAYLYKVGLLHRMKRNGRVIWGELEPKIKAILTPAKKKTGDRVGPISDRVGPISDRVGPISDRVGPISDHPPGPIWGQRGPISDHTPYNRDREYIEHLSPVACEGDGEERQPRAKKQQPAHETKRDHSGTFDAFVGPLPSWEDPQLRRRRAAAMAVDEMRERDGYLKVERSRLIERFARSMSDDEVDGRLRQVEGEEAMRRWYAAENFRLEIEERERKKRQAIHAKRMAEFRALPADEQEHWISQAPMRSVSVAESYWRRSKGA